MELAANSVVTVLQYVKMHRDNDTITISVVDNGNMSIDFMEHFQDYALGTNFKESENIQNLEVPFSGPSPRNS